MSHFIPFMAFDKYQTDFKVKLLATIGNDLQIVQNITFRSSVFCFVLFKSWALHYLE